MTENLEPSSQPMTPDVHDHGAGPQRSETRTALFQLVLIVVAALIGALVAGVAKTLAVVVAIVLMIVVHEFGHFITAKWSGMKVEQFFVGFGPRLWSIRRGDTEYGIRALPLGGFVKVIGMNNLEHVDPADEKRSYRSSPVWRRVVMASAGSFMHMVMAFGLAFSLFGIVGLPVIPSTEVGELVAFRGTSPAQAAGVQLHDQVRSINGVSVNEWNDVRRELAKSRAGVPVVIAVDRGGQRLDLTVTPIDRRSVVFDDGTKAVVGAVRDPIGFIGVGPNENATIYRTLPVGTSLARATHTMTAGSVAVVKAIGDRFSPSGLREYYDNVVGNVPADQQAKADENRFVSPVGVVNVANNAAQSGWYAVLTLLFSFNLFIGIFNMIPLLPFDGGHVAVALYEKVRSIRRPRYQADYAKLLPVSYAVILVLVLISGSSLYLDIFKPLPNQFK